MTATGQRRVLRRAPLPTPAFGALDPALREALLDMSAALAGLRDVDHGLVTRDGPPVFASLRHELSDHYEALNTKTAMPGRSLAEHALLDGLAPFECPTRSTAWVAAMNSCLTGEADPWRKSEMRLEADRSGAVIILPSASFASHQLRETWRLFDDPVAGPVVWRATVVLALFVNCHPFKDGNGRVARILFNSVLREGGMPRSSYVPFYEIAAQSKGGYEIALRCAEIRGDWAPLLDYVVRALSICKSAAPKTGESVARARWR